jgi:hypothetical protein
MRHIGEATTAPELLVMVAADLDRAARLLDTGLWSFHLMVEGRKTKDQLRDAGVAAEQARQQVMSALRDAKSAFQRAHREIHELKRAAAQEKHRQAREAARLRGRGRS